MSEKRYQIENRIEALQKQLENLDLLPEADGYPNGAMVRLVTRPKYDTRGKSLTYLLLKVEHENMDATWYFTGRLDLSTTNSTASRALNFTNLIDIITRYHVVVEWDQLTVFKSTAAGDSPNWEEPSGAVTDELPPIHCGERRNNLVCIKPRGHVDSTDDTVKLHTWVTTK